MYVTRPLSLYKKFPQNLSMPPEGPNSGYLVLQDEESETVNCCGFKNSGLIDLPFPQNKNLNVGYDSEEEDVVFIPVLNQPLSSNRYYVLQLHGKHIGEAHTCSKEENKITCCFGGLIKDVKPRPLDFHDIYQQFEIVCETACSSRGGFSAKSIAPDGFPPNLLRNKGWQIYTKTPKSYELTEAPGLNTALRAQLPGFNFPVSCKSSEAAVIGKWHCPFMFIKEGTLRDQTKKSMFYEMTLEQKWVQIFSCENDESEGNAVFMDVAVQTEVVLIGDKEAIWDEKNVVGGVIKFTSFGHAGEEMSVGLNLAIVERMKWEQERVGWIAGDGRQASVKRVEEFEGIGGWKKFGCYVLVERFVLKRMDGSLVMTYDFRHTHQIKSKWE